MPSKIYAFTVKKLIRRGFYDRAFNRTINFQYITYKNRIIESSELSINKTYCKFISYFDNDKIGYVSN